ncbi:MAG: GNAT family N-acetyltransferase [Candidatus Thermoplasmatota archaeon]
MEFAVVPFDPVTASREEWRRYHAYRRRRHAETYPEDPLSDDETIETLLRRPHPEWDATRFVVLVPADEQVGELAVEHTREGAPSHETNKHLAFLDVEVLRPHRRRGIGGAMFAKGVEEARARGRTVLQSWVEEEDGRAFADSLGAKVVQHRQQNRLQLERLDWAMVAGWAKDGLARSPKTRVRWFKNHIDDDVLPTYCPIYTEVFNQQPFGDQDVGDFIFTPENFREREARMASVGATWTTAIAQEEDGAISGLTETWYYPDEATMMFQGFTAVREADRGRGLGKWLKAVMLLRVHAEYPQVRTIVTNNASENAAMLAINERLGFRTYRKAVVAQMTLEEAERYLAGRPQVTPPSSARSPRAGT